MGQQCQLVAYSPLPSSPLLPASSHLLPFPFSAKIQAQWVLEAPRRPWEQRWRGEVGEGDKLPHAVLVRCSAGSSHRSHPLQHWLFIMPNCVHSLSSPMNWVTIVQGDGEGGPCPRELTWGGERWPQAHRQVEIIRRRLSCHCDMTEVPGGEGTDKKKIQKYLWWTRRLRREGWVNYLNTNQTVLEGVLLFWVSSFPVYDPGKGS